MLLSPGEPLWHIMLADLQAPQQRAEIQHRSGHGSEPAGSTSCSFSRERLTDRTLAQCTVHSSPGQYLLSPAHCFLSSAVTAVVLSS